MLDAAAAGASLAHFPEGALWSPNKRVMSSRGPEVVADADGDLVDRAALRAELDAVARVARNLRLWVAVGGIDFAPGRSRPTNSLFVISGCGAIVGRYDERMLSRTKSLFMYEAGTRPVVFEVGGVRFGCALGMESQYPELFAAYERDDVDCVLLSTAGNPEFPEVFAVEAAGHAAANFVVGELRGRGRPTPAAGRGRHPQRSLDRPLRLSRPRCDGPHRDGHLDRRTRPNMAPLRPRGPDSRIRSPLTRCRPAFHQSRVCR
ncbi:MAG: carbon-nitrogen hydrolase family protein [Solirubrobacteraceae bacterium]